MRTGLPSLAQEVRGRLRDGSLAGVIEGRRGGLIPSGGGLAARRSQSPWVNRMMGGVSAFERRAFGLFGVGLPFGHSTMVLADQTGGRLMKIGIDGACLANRRGFGRFAGRWSRRWRRPGRHEFVVFVDRPSLELVSMPEGMETVVVDVSEAPSRAASATGRRRVGDMLAMARAVAKANLDVIYFPASYSFFPVWNAGRVVVTMHDTLALAHPEWVFPTGEAKWPGGPRSRPRRSGPTGSSPSPRPPAAISSPGSACPKDRVKVVSEGPDAIFQPEESGPTSDVVLRTLWDRFRARATSSTSAA